MSFSFIIVPPGTFTATVGGQTPVDATIEGAASLSAGIAAIGPKGDKGDQGEQGIQGPQGIQGLKGDTGETGAKGDKGDTGDTGPAGPSGVIAATGPLAYDSFTQTVSIDSTSPSYGVLMASTMGLPTFASSPQITINTAGTNTILGRDSLYGKWLTGSEVADIIGLGTMAYTSVSDYMTAAGIAANYATIAAGVPIGGTTGQALVKSSNSDYDTTWTTLQLGDRYATTSTTSLTISTGSKTLTIGTGLAYTSQQSIIIAYNASNHMHGEVTSYNPGTGVLMVDVQQKTGSGTYASWTVNVGGISSIATWGQITGTLSNQTDLQSALDAKAALASPTFTGDPQAPTPATSDNDTSIATTAFSQSLVDSQRVDIQTFGGPTSSGTFTWTKPAGAKMVEVIMFGGGGGGAAGHNQPTSVSRWGGGAGAGGAKSIHRIPASELGSTVTVVVGAGGSGAAGRATNGIGADGITGTQSLFGNYRAHQGANGYNTTSSGVGGTAQSGSVYNAVATGNPYSGGGGNIGGGGAGGGNANGYLLSTGGGGGGGQAAGSNVSVNGGNAGSRTNGTPPAAYTVTLAGGAGGNWVMETPATNGSNQDVPLAGGTGGGGGWYRPGRNGGNGGNGGWPGGGGGGGGACESGFTSGSGGNGANGMVTVITYF